MLYTVLVLCIGGGGDGRLMGTVSSILYSYSASVVEVMDDDGASAENV
jgi:hypothetical protein